MREDLLSFCRQLREHCRLQQWYGPDLRKPRPKPEHEMEYFSYDADVVIDDPVDHALEHAFAFPPASEAQLQETESTLGCPLPALLRAVYRQVANGGFGPGCGLVGAIGGFDEAGTLVSNYRFYTKRCELLNLSQALLPEQEMPLRLPEGTWPRFLLLLCDWGNATTSCVDARTGHVYRVHVSFQERCTFLELEVPSLYAWWLAWIDGRLRQPTPLPDPEVIRDPEREGH